MKITPFIIGSGGSGQAIAKSFAVLAITSPELKLEPAQFIPRGTELKTVASKVDRSILCIANPHALHADLIVKGMEAGFQAIACEKPSCVNSAQLEKLVDVRIPVAILHGYRQMWGPQCLKGMIAREEFGDIITLEGRYWQGSAAERSTAKLTGLQAMGWKDDLKLAGDSDTLVDIGVHWLDMACYLMEDRSPSIVGWKSYANAESAHRDTHVQMMLNFKKGGRGWASFSKTVHGATNHFEMNVIGTRKSATWKFLNPDEIVIGEGRDTRTITRKKADGPFGGHLPPFHGMGWMEGYTEILRQLALHTFYNQGHGYPELRENILMMKSLFAAQWS
jgi:predicted dehydrogenase